MSAHDDVNAEEGGVDVGLSKVKLENLVAYQVSEVQVTHLKHVVGVGGHDVEDLTDFWRCRSCLSRLEHC